MLLEADTKLLSVKEFYYLNIRT